MEEPIKPQLNDKLVSSHQKSSETMDDPKTFLTGTLNENVANNYCLYFYIFCILGLVNNIGYVMVGTASHDLAVQFNQENLMPLFQLAEISFGGFVKFFNSKYLINVKHSVRLTINSGIMLVAYILIAAVTIKQFEAGFWISLFCALLHGGASSLGESTILGLMKGFPSRLVGAFSSGTGFAGVGGTAIFLIFKPFMSDGFIFLIAIPLVFLYYLNSMFAIKKKNTLPFVEENPEAEERARSVRQSMGDNEDMLEVLSVEGVDIGEDANDNIPMNIVNVMIVFKKIGWYLSNLTAVYFLEYSVTTSFTNIMATKISNNAVGDEKDNYFVKNAYVIFAFCYQFGVLISRSSLDLIHIKRVGIITVLQLINFVFWFVNAQLFFLTNIYILSAWMIFIGLMGGASYVNVMYLILNSKRLKKNEKELAVMTTCIFCDMGVLVASILALILANTLFLHVTEIK